jgi:hypothetical protein
MCCALNLLHYAILCILTLTFHLHSCQSYIFKAQNKWRDAKAAYLKALEIDSGNAEYQAQLQEIEAKIQEDSRSSSTEGCRRSLVSIMYAYYMCLYFIRFYFFVDFSISYSLFPNFNVNFTVYDVYVVYH